MTSREYAEIDRRVRGNDAINHNEVLSYEGGDVHILPFTSAHSGHLIGPHQHKCLIHDLTFSGEKTEDDIADSDIEENIRFRYPLVREPAREGPLRHHDRLIILLHGLNERSFTKYLLWAFRLRLSTQIPVLLFPLSFHINRSYPAWLLSQNTLYEQRQQLVGNDHSHRFNAVISERLDKRPERFFWGGVQSYLELVDLVRDIRSGAHPHFLRDTRVDFLGYSAGGYLSLTLLLEDPEGLFSTSRAVIFGSCAALRDISLASPMILDSTAENALIRMYVRQIDNLSSERMKHWFQYHAEGKWFRALSGMKADSGLIEPRLKEMAGRVLGIANINDNVIPAGSTFNTLQGLRRDTGVPVLEFELGLHESPFVCGEYGQSYRRFVTQVLDEKRYGEAFEHFIEACASHFRM